MIKSCYLKQMPCSWTDDKNAALKKSKNSRVVHTLFESVKRKIKTMNNMISRMRN